MLRIAIVPDGEWVLDDEGAFVLHLDAQAEITRLTAELAKRGEPVAWQHLKDGKWVECSEVVAKEWGDRYGPIYVRPLYAHPSTASAGVTVKPLEWHAVNEVGHGRANYGSGVFGHWYAVSRSKSKCWMVAHHIGGKPVHFGPFVSLDAAKAAAQADYERRILDALSPTVEQGEG